MFCKVILTPSLSNVTKMKIHNESLQISRGITRSNKELSDQIEAVNIIKQLTKDQETKNTLSKLKQEFKITINAIVDNKIYLLVKTQS